jgi:hypothetical protein
MPEQNSDHRPYADAGEVIASLNGIRELIAGNRREYVEKFDRLESAIARIEKQVLKTNGRVTGLELSRAFTYGAVAVTTTIFGSGLAWIAFFGGGK